MRWRHYKIARERMVREQLYDRGIRDKRVLEAMLMVPRHVFLDREAGSEAYCDHSFPIGYSQTMSQPFMVAYLAEQLKLGGQESVLEIGTGSGYTAAILGALTKEVFSIERVAALASKARESLQDLLFRNVIVEIGDGANGWPDKGPFDRVLLTAAAKQVPKSLLMQLKDGGIFLGPVEKTDGSQEIVRLTREGDTFALERLIDCSFVPLIRDPAIRPQPAQMNQGEGYAR